jgi:hypothetical protein
LAKPDRNATGIAGILAKTASSRALAGYLGALHQRLTRIVPLLACKSGEMRVARHALVAAMSNKMTCRPLSKFAQRGALLAPRSTAISHSRSENRTLDCF